MKDGLYQVTTDYLCAGFIIVHGHVVQCAPILRRRFTHYKSFAKYICL